MVEPLHCLLIISGGVRSMARQLLAVCLVLVIGMAGVVPSLIYSQDSATPLQLAWQSAASDGFTAIAVFDFDNDGDDDLAIGRRNLPTQLWRNDGVDAGGQPVFTLIWSSTTARETVALAWAVTSGGALLLAEANYDDVSVIYRVTPVGGGVTVTVQFTTQSLFAQTIVWGILTAIANPICSSAASLNQSITTSVRRSLLAGRIHRW